MSDPLNEFDAQQTDDPESAGAWVAKDGDMLNLSWLRTLPPEAGQPNWAFLIPGMRAYRFMKAGRYASAAHTLAAAIHNRLIPPDLWRTSVLLNYVVAPIKLADGDFGRKRRRKSI